LAHTRNRIRHELLPLLSTYNPQIARQLARVASIAADEETYWQGELQRLMPALLLPGRPTRGGGRSASTHPEQETVAIEALRLKQMHPAVARRVLRAAARRLGARLSFEHTEQLLALAGAETRTKSKFDLPGGITVERSLREIRMTKGALEVAVGPEVEFLMPGEVHAPEYNVYLRVACVGTEQFQAKQATLRTWKPGDRVTLRFSRGPKKVADVLDRLHVVGPARKNWPVIELEGNIVWMRGVSVDAPAFLFTPVT
jgi:tRNA(Ile)-lysidine synthase